MKVFFFVNLGMFPSKHGRTYLREKVIEFEKYLENEGIPRENNFHISVNKVYFMFLGVILFLPLAMVIIQSIGKVLFK